MVLFSQVVLLSQVVLFSRVVLFSSGSCSVGNWICWRRYRNGYIGLLVLRLLIGYVREAIETGI